MCNTYKYIYKSNSVTQAIEILGIDTNPQIQAV